MVGGLRLSWRPRAMGEPVGKSVRRDWTDLPCCVVGFSVNRGRGFTESSGAVRQGLAPRQPPQNSLSPSPGGRPGPVAHGPLHHNCRFPLPSRFGPTRFAVSIYRFHLNAREVLIRKRRRLLRTRTSCGCPDCTGHRSVGSGSTRIWDIRPAGRRVGVTRHSVDADTVVG